VLELIGSAGKVNVEDKVRLICVWALTVPSVSSNDINEVVQLLKSSSVVESPDQLTSGIKAIEYVKTLRSMHNFSNIASSVSNKTPPPSGGVANLSNLMNVGTGLLAKAADKVGNLVLGKSTKFYATRVVEAMLKDNRGIQLNESSGMNEFLLLDPKLKNGGGGHGGGSQPPVTEVIFFAIGGGSYNEYNNLKTVVEGDGEGGSLGASLVYGATDMVNAASFLSQMDGLS